MMVTPKRGSRNRGDEWLVMGRYNRGSGLGNSSYIGHWEGKASAVALGVSTFDLGETLTQVPGL